MLIGTGLTALLQGALAMVGYFVTGVPQALILGLLTASTADNLVRPLLARYAELRLHSLLLFMAMLGGIVILGTWGLLFGPLFVRLATEGLTMLKEEREARGAVDARS
jgi:predicted PurR-regulated permease PerM